MFVNIQSFILDAGIDAKAVDLLDGIEKQDATSGCPEVDDKYAEGFCSKESPAVAVESAIGCGEQTCQQSAKDAADTVYGACAHRVVDVQDVVNELNGIDKYGATHKSDDHCSDGRNEVATGSDAHQTS